MNSRSTLVELFAFLNDEDLCDTISAAIEDKYGFENLAHWMDFIPEERRTIHYAWSMTSYLRNEGFSQFWSTKCDHFAYAKAFGNLGLSLQEQNILASLEELSARPFLGNYELLVKHFGSEVDWQAKGKKFQKILFDGYLQILKHLSVYVRSRRTSLSDLSCEIISRYEDHTRPRVEKRRSGWSQFPSVQNG